VTRSKIIVIVIVGLFIILQLIPLNQTNPPIIQDASAPSDIDTILRTSCYDCHSNETVWPWCWEMDFPDKYGSYSKPVLALLGFTLVIRIIVNVNMVQVVLFAVCSLTGDKKNGE